MTEAYSHLAHANDVDGRAALVDLHDETTAVPVDAHASSRSVDLDLEIH